MIDPEIVADAQFVQRLFRVPAAVAIAQYRIESANGTKFTGDFNCWGIKEFNPARPHKMCLTHEGTDPNAVWQPFRCYASLKAAFADYGKLLSTDHRYAAAMSALPNQDRFIDLMSPVYATGKGYNKLVKSIISGSNLNQYNL